MAAIHNALTRTTLSNALTRALGDTRGRGGIERYGETLTPIIDLWGRDEWAMLRDEVMWGAAGSVAAGAAGTFAKIGIRNPDGSGLIVVVTHHIVTGVAVAVGVQLEMSTAILASTAVVVPRDRRITSARGPVAMSEASAGAALTAVVEVTAVPGDNIYIEWPVVLPPGQACQWRTSDDAASLTASFRGYYRLALPGELLV